MNEEGNKVSQWYIKNLLKGNFSKYQTISFWLKTKEQGNESPNGEYLGSTKTGAKAARRYSCRCDIEIMEINTYICKLSNLQCCHISRLTAN